MPIDEKLFEILYNYREICIQKYSREFEEFEAEWYEPPLKEPCLSYINYRLNTNEKYLLMREQLHQKRNDIVKKSTKM